MVVVVVVVVVAVAVAVAVVVVVVVVVDLRPEFQLLFGGVNADFGRRPVWTGTYIVVVFDGSRWTRSRS